MFDNCDLSFNFVDIINAIVKEVKTSRPIRIKSKEEL